MKILAIGNSFSQDAFAYINNLASAAGDDCKVVNLYIGGCSLENHWFQYEHNLCFYEYELNGKNSGAYVSIDEVLDEEEWDIISLQQCSGLSGVEESYEPYLSRLIKAIKEKKPNSKLVLHETWAYDEGSLHEDFGRYELSQSVMYNQLHLAYKKMGDLYNLFIVPSGTLIQNLRGYEEFDSHQGGQSLCRDGFHLHGIYGRYAVACLWYLMFISEDKKIEFIPPNRDDDLYERKIQIILQEMNKIISKT